MRVWYVAKSFADAHAIPHDVWLAAESTGLLGLEVPTRFGCGEAGDWFNAVAREELARAGFVERMELNSR